MEKNSALLAIWAGNSTVTGEFPTQRPVTRSFDVLFDLRLNKCLSKQSRAHYDVIVMSFVCLLTWDSPINQLITTEWFIALSFVTYNGMLYYIYMKKIQ